MGLPYFDAYVKELEHIHAEFMGTFRGLVACPWQPEMDKSWPVISAYTRYFTARQFADRLTESEFFENVDPHKILERSKGTNFVHTTENVVLYYRRVQEMDGTFGYVVFLAVSELDEYWLGIFLSLRQRLC